jgi:hypothetical protein
MSVDNLFGGDEPPGDPFLYGVIDQLIQKFGAPELAPELALARDDYEARRGRVRQDEELWEVWTQIFLEWFALEWRGAGQGDAAPPAARALARELDGRTRSALEAWLRSQRALVEVIALRPGVVRVRDLLRGGLFEVAEQRSLHGVGTGDIAEVRLIGFDGRVRFGRTFLFHPSGTRAALGEQVEQRLAQGTSPEAVLDHVAALRLRTERYRHVDPVRLYRAATEELGEA